MGAGMLEATLRDAFSVAGHGRLKAWFSPVSLRPGRYRVKVVSPAGSEAGGSAEPFPCAGIFQAISAPALLATTQKTTVTDDREKS